MNTILIFSVVAFYTIQTIFCDDTLVRVQQGWLQGKRQRAVSDDCNYYSFENIPYAKPPTGSLRFKAPEEPTCWEGTRDATAPGCLCPHYNPMTDVTVLGSEDCLTCDVYTPDISKKLPVFFFVSGFAYFFDQDVKGVYGPDFLVKDMVVVRCNRRKDALGFLNLGTKDVPGNAALKDDVAALQWVHENIHVFGGDKNRITLAGLSSGSAAVSHHLYSPMSAGLFDKAIMLSGVHSCDAVYPDDVMEKSFELGARLGCETEDETKLLTCLQNLPYEQFINASYALARETPTNILFKKMAEFVPTVEKDCGQKRFITEDPMESLYHAPLNKVKLLTSFSRDETLLFINQYCDDRIIERYNETRELCVPFKILKTCPPDVDEIADAIKKFYFGEKDICKQNLKEFFAMTSFTNMIYEVIRFARKYSPHADTYLFEFNSVSDRNIYGREGLKYGITGTSHADILGYLFPATPLNMTLDMKSREHDLIVQLVERIRDFVKTGNPSHSAKFSWRKFTPKRPYYVEFTDTTKLKKGPKGAEMKLLDKIYRGHKVILH